MSKESQRKRLQTDFNYRSSLFQQADNYFKQHPGETKLFRKDTSSNVETPISFLRSEKGKLFALTGHRYRTKQGKLITGSDADGIKLIQDNQGKKFFLKRHRKGIEKDSNWKESLEVMRAMFGNDFHEVKRGKIIYHVYPYLGEDFEAYIDRKLAECQEKNSFSSFSKTLLDLCRQAIALVEDFHNKDFVHADIKLNNFTVILKKRRKPTLKLIDFGIARNIKKYQPLQLSTFKKYKQIPDWAFTYEQSEYLYTFTQDSDRWTLGWAFDYLIQKAQKKNRALGNFLRKHLSEAIKTLQTDSSELNNIRLEKAQNPIPLKDIPTYAIATQKGKVICAVAGVSWGVSATSGLIAWILSSCSLPDASIQSALLIGLAITAIVSFIAAIPTTSIVTSDTLRYFAMNKIKQSTYLEVPKKEA